MKTKIMLLTEKKKKKKNIAAAGYKCPVKIELS